MDYDPLVVKLNKDISAIEEAMGAALQQHKFQYIFEGQRRPGVKYIYTAAWEIWFTLPFKAVCHVDLQCPALILLSVHHLCCSCTSLSLSPSLRSPARSGSSDLLYSNQWGPVLQEDQWVRYQEDVQEHLCSPAESHQHHHVQGGRPRLRKVSVFTGLARNAAHLEQPLSIFSLVFHCCFSMAHQKNTLHPQNSVYYCVYTLQMKADNLGPKIFCTFSCQHFMGPFIFVSPWVLLLSWWSGFWYWYYK